MPSQRRVKVFALLAVLAVLSFIYLSSAAASTRSSPFYTNTANALNTKHQEALDLENHQIIHEAAEKAEKEKEAANIRDPDLAAVPGQKSVAGRKMIKGEKGLKDDGVAKVGNTGAQHAQAADPDETEEEHKAEVELDSILKKSPIVIFSKSYCPYSKKAKAILLEQYNIVPAPYVEELDLHPLGPQLQAALLKTTGRRTVPNVLINGKSIGGGDDIAGLHENDKLIQQIKDLGGKRIMEVSKAEPKAALKFRS
ncbi:glutaredoxin [Aureobasidium melanogenum CBS 110374]|uniref:Glutaredoxin n=1 Tax=Aureobasidium melanogenum (strain CBS 110374) TaxID=1043003 RepID=A0A074VM63_AURM1|nr:glutaredoxin [Aureobasidium melanogenum CBS 110374]KEQ58767.1 glutaredoxin [Aureobasidium melanogenum CBS 110374]